MVKVSVSSAKKFVRSKKGMTIIAVLLVLIVGGTFYAVGRHDKKQPVATQSAADTKDPQAVAGTSDTNTTAPADTTTPATDNPDTAPATTPADTPASTTPSSTPAVTPSLPPAVYADNFSGTWYINFGSMVLTQSGTTVSGTYTNATQAKTGNVAGTVSGQTLTGTWAINGTHGPISLVKSTHKISGTYNSTYKWCGALKGYQFPDGCGFSGHWVTKLPAGGADCAMDLVRINNIVTGTYCNGKIDTGTISYPSGDIKLSGNWKIGSATGPYAFFLSSLTQSPQQLFFQGNYGNTSYWCGGATASDQPATANCLKN